MHPRPYLSHRQLILWEQSPDAYIQTYFYGKTIPINRGMALGKQLADALEKDEETGDPIKDVVISQIHTYELRDREILATLKHRDGSMQVLAKPDSCKKDFSAFLEYKTGLVPWTQNAVDENSQLTFYATVLFLIAGKIPQIRLDHIQTRRNGQVPEFTGEINSFYTSRTVGQIMKMMVRMRKAWREIDEETNKRIV